MRKDVRMGFAVGGVLLAVIVVAVLVFHRNKNANKAVSLDTDPGKNSPQVIDTGTPDLSAKSAETPATPTPIESQPLTPAQPAAKGAADPAPAADAAQKGGDKWDALFNSTAEDPIKAQLTSGNSKPKNKKKHRSDAAPAAAAPAPAPVHESAPAESGSANIPLEAIQSTQAEAPRHTPVVIADPAPAAAPAKESSRTHTIAAGETFVSIARAVYGDGKYFKAIEDANPNVDPGKLKPGMTVHLPPASQVKEARKSAKASGGSSSGSSLSADGRTYTVQKNDSLYRIAKKVYGTGTKSDDLYAANKQTIGPDSTRLKVGMVLTLPEAPTAR
jgi:nucleoid-associated protein YgaU